MLSVTLRSLRCLRTLGTGSRTLWTGSSVRVGPPVPGSWSGSWSGSRTLWSGSRTLWRRSVLSGNLQSSSRCLSSSPDDGVLVYTGSLGTAVRGVKMFSYTSSGFTLLLMPHLLLNTGLLTHGVAMTTLTCCIVGVFTFITPVLLHMLTRGYVVRLYYRPDQDVYTAVTYSVVLTERRTRFHQTEVRVPAVSRMFTSFTAGGAGLLVNPDTFARPSDYNHLMGYDKPFSFNPEDQDQDQS